MTRIALLVLLLVFLFPAAARADTPTHIVAYGETLYSIARKYGVTPQALARANGLSAQSWVYAGQRLIIPGSGSTNSNAPAPASQTSPGGIYVVRAGDTLYAVARKFGVAVQAIADANDIPPNGFLYTGWQLKIPGAAAASKQDSAPPANSALQNENAPAQNTNPNSTAVSYIVQPGDTLFGIAVKHGVTLQALRIANNLATHLVYAGQRLTIPNAASNSAPANNSTASASIDASAREINLRLTGVPLYRQKKTLSCEEAVAAMATFGALSESEILAAMPRSENPYEGIRGEPDYEFFGGLTHYGTYAQGLQKGLTKLGRQSTAYYGQPYAQFKESILENLKQGRPVIWWTTWRESYQKPQQVALSNGATVTLVPYEHTVLIVAANDKGITYHDPYDGTIRFTNWKNHQRTSGYFNNMALVVY